MINLLVGLALTLSAAGMLAAILLRPAELPLNQLRQKYAGPTSRFLTLRDGAVIHVRVEGPASAPVLLMVPGLHSSLNIWDGWMAALGDEFRVISVDLPGQGLSDSWPRDDYSIPALDGFISEVTDALGVREFTFAGHSMSGAMAWRYALAHPERVEGLVLVAAGGFVTAGAGPILPFRVLAAPVIGPIARRFLTRPLIRRILKRGFADPAHVTDQMVERYFEMVNADGHRASLGQRLAYLMSYQPVSDVDPVRTPTLVLWGELDRLRPVVYAGMFGAHIQGSSVRVYPNVGHFPMEEMPEATATEVRAFLRRR